MTFFFGDGFDLYTADADPVSAGTYWDASSTVFLNIQGAAGRFAGSRAMGTNASTRLDKVSGQNDAVHHFVVAILYQNAVSGSGLGTYFELFDSTTAQCTVVFRTDGAILLTSGGPTGTVLATYTGAVVAQNVWYAFEIEVVVNNASGSIAVRKNGNTSNDFFLGSLNTRNSANNYANKLSFGSQGSQSMIVDDVLWRSDASSVAWVGDVRCYTRMPAADSSIQWSQGGAVSGISQSVAGGGVGASISNVQARLSAYVASYNGMLASITGVATSGASGNIKGAVWADNSGVPGAVLATAGPQAAVAVGNNTLALTTPIALSAGTKIWIGFISDTSSGTWSTLNSAGAGGGFISASYATFPQANPVLTTAQAITSSIIYGAPAGNAGFVSEAQQDAAVSYVYATTVGQSDLYTIAGIANTPATTLAVVTRGYFEKSDAGTRNCAVQLKSGSTTVQSASTALNTVWGWLYRTDLVDPATGSAWTAVGVNNVKIGPVLTA